MPRFRTELTGGTVSLPTTRGTVGSWGCRVEKLETWIWQTKVAGKK